MNSRLVPREEVTPAIRAKMFALFSDHFEGVELPQFQSDLEEKNWVILLEDDTGRLQGFSTILLYRAAFEGERFTVLYSGDTIVAPSAWASFTLPAAWIDAIKILHRDHGEGRLYWLLLSSGFRTYRYLPVFWRSFYPRFDCVTPVAVRRRIEWLAVDRFAEHYDPAAGIVRFETPQVLRGSLKEIPESRMRDPHVTFFARANPGYVQGDELVCLTELADDNLTPAGRRMVRVGASRRAPTEVKA